MFPYFVWFLPPPWNSTTSRCRCLDKVKASANNDDDPYSRRSSSTLSTEGIFPQKKKKTSCTQTCKTVIIQSELLLYPSHQNLHEQQYSTITIINISELNCLFFSLLSQFQCNTHIWLLTLFTANTHTHHLITFNHNSNTHKWPCMLYWSYISRLASRPQLSCQVR